MLQYIENINLDEFVESHHIDGKQKGHMQGVRPACFPQARLLGGAQGSSPE